METLTVDSSGRIYVLLDRNRTKHSVLVLNAIGKRVAAWTKPIALAPTATSDGTLLAGIAAYPPNGGIASFTSGGRLRWLVRTRNSVRGAPNISSNGDVFIGSHDNDFYIIPSGDPKKSRHVRAGHYVWAGCAIDRHDYAYFVDATGRLYRTDAQGSTATIISSEKPGLGYDYQIPPVLSPDGQLLAYRQYSGYTKLEALSSTGKLQWTVKADRSPDPPSVDQEGRIYTRAENGDLLCLSEDGKQVWHLPVSEYGRLFHPVIDGNGRLFAGSQYIGRDKKKHGRKVFCLSRDGKPMWTLELEPITSRPVIGPNRSILVATRNHLYCIE
jgi:outer membrane protein assembly factor BamB